MTHKTTDSERVERDFLTSILEGKNCTPEDVVGVVFGTPDAFHGGDLFFGYLTGRGVRESEDPNRKAPYDHILGQRSKRSICPLVDDDNLGAACEAIITFPEQTLVDLGSRTVVALYHNDSTAPGYRTI